MQLVAIPAAQAVARLFCKALHLNRLANEALSRSPTGDIVLDPEMQRAVSSCDNSTIGNAIKYNYGE